MPHRIILSTCVLASGQRTGTKPLASATKSVDVTRVDFTKITGLRSTELTVFGIRLGQKVEQARLVAQNAGLKWNVEASARGPLPVVSGEKGPDLFHLGVSADEVTRIALQPGIAQFLQGRCA